jgi:hypothetical protein
MITDIVLSPGDIKQPDIHYTLDPSRIPANILPSFPKHATRNTILPIVAVEIAYFNESLRKLADTDSQRFFAPGSGTRVSIGLKIYIDEDKGEHRWWAGLMERDFDAQTNRFLDTATIQPPLFPRVPKNQLMSIPVPGQRLSIDVAKSIYPMPLPANTPPFFHIDLEQFRLNVLRSLQLH